MTRARFHEITARYAALQIVLVGDFCLDRYLEIDPARAAVSIETGLPVRNVVRVRSQPGGAGTILNNLAALGVGAIYPIGFCGDDGEGYELRRALRSVPGVNLEHFIQTGERRTFTYCKPLVMHAGLPPQELNRLDSKNWDPTPAPIEDQIIRSFQQLADNCSAAIVLDQVDHPDTGVVTRRVREAIGEITQARPRVPILADSRQGLRDWPPLDFKMNGAELATLLGQRGPLSREAIFKAASDLAQRNGRRVVVTLAEAGAVGAQADGTLASVPAWPVSGPIDVVGAGDAVTANLTAATAAGADLREALELAMAAAHVVIHQLGTTGVASIEQLRKLLKGA
jgi:rfaE bifunctional protein kinase chain/domain